MDWIGISEKFGLLGVVVIVVAAGFFFILKWVLEQFKIELQANRVERKEYLEILAGINQELNDHNIRAKEFQCAVQSEHKEMIVTLGRINGYKHD